MLLMLSIMKRHTDGFTIVELLIVIVTMGILLGIVFVGWSAVSTWSRDRARESDVQQWVSSFEAYKGRFAVWPALPANDLTPKAICLGVPLSGNNRCIQYGGTTEFNGILGTYASITNADYTSLSTEVKKIGNFPTNGSPIIKNIAAGPFAYLSQTTTSGTVTVIGKFFNFFEAGCPNGFTRETTSPTPNAPFTTLLATIPASTYVCWTSKTLTYTPS
jgi:type II secretory pathway pseudopilin PulG